MINQEIENGLKQLGFNYGWVITNNEITLWENAAPQPTEQEIQEAADLWEQTQLTLQAEADIAKAAAEAKLEALGLTADDLKALGL
jgi:hypothetical protein